jgi:hypothetical protein
MIRDETVTIQTKTRTKNSEGMWLDDWADSTETLLCNIQPTTLSEVQLSQWGAIDSNSAAKLMFYINTSSVALFTRIKRSNGEVYEVRNINQWRVHNEATLIPIQGD